MQILMALIALLGGAVFWWWRIKAVSEAASEVQDVAGRAWGKYKRAKFRRKAEAAPVEAVEDPVAAAVVMMLAVAKIDGPMTDRTDALIQSIVRDDLQVGDITELMIFTKWVVGHVHDANDVSRRYSKLWGNALNMAERREFLEMVRRVASVNGVVSREKEVTLAKLRERLGLSP
jgi:uncharacterized tellurite resistance protein B-like protein